MSRWPLDFTSKIRMSQQFRCRPESREADQDDLKSGPPGMLHRRNAVGVVRRQRYSFDGVVCRQVGDVDTDPHVHALLLKIRIEIRVGEWLPRSVRNLGGI